MLFIIFNIKTKCKMQFLEINQTYDVQMNWINFNLINFLDIGIIIYVKYPSTLPLISHNVVSPPYCRSVCRNLIDVEKLPRTKIKP